MKAHLSLGPSQVGTTGMEHCKMSTICIDKMNWLLKVFNNGNNLKISTK